MTRIIYDTNTGQDYPYPRTDDEPIVGLDPSLVVLQVIREPMPEPGEGFSISEAAPVDDLEARTRIIGWIVTPATSTEPNYTSLLIEVLKSSLYPKILAQSKTSLEVNTAFTAAMGSLLLAAAGLPIPDAVQAGVGDLLTEMTLTPEDAAEVDTVVKRSNLDKIISIPAIKP